MKTSHPSNEQVDVISSDDSSSSDAEMEVTTEYDSMQLTSEGALMRRAEMYQEYMKHIPIPTHRGCYSIYLMDGFSEDEYRRPWMPSFIPVKPKPPPGSLKKFTETPHLIIM